MRYMKKQPKWKTYKKCLDCDKTLRDYYSKRCKVCHGISRSGIIPKNIFKKGHTNYFKKHSEESKKKIKENHARYWLGKDQSGMTGKKQSNYQKKMASLVNKDKIVSQTTKDKISNSKKGIAIWSGHRENMNWMIGEKNKNWKGGITPINKALRDSFEYEEWRKNVFERDLYTCRNCGIVGGYLEADHIKPFAYYPLLRFDLNNGRTLCKLCHKKTDTYMVKARWINYEKG